MHPWIRTSALALWVLPCGARSQHDYFVDGRIGTDRPDAGTSAADPWKTITYALARIPTPAPTAAHALRVAGAQTYSAAGNGESFPLLLRAGVRLLGSSQGAARPVLSVPVSETGLTFDPAATFEHARDLVEDLVIEGGLRGIALWPAVGVRHAPTLRRCTVRGLNRGTNVTLAASAGARADPRFVACDFLGGLTGISVAGAEQGSVVRPEIEECTVAAQFAGMSVAGGALVYRSRVGGFAGIHIFAGPDSSTTAVELVQSQFSGFEGVYLDVDRPAGGHVAIESCYFPGGGEEGLLMHGAFAAGSAFSVTLADNVVERATHNGFAFELSGTGGDVRIAMRRNLGLRHPLANAFSLRCDEGVGLRFDSEGDRAFDNGTGMTLVAGASASIRIANGMFCRNDDQGLVLDLRSADATGSFLTAADNGQVGIWATSASTGLRLDHCVLAGNGTGQLVLPGAASVAWSCLAGQPWPGPGNLASDPRLLPNVYKLAPGSPCVDAGDPGLTAAPDTDYEGDPRRLPGRVGGLRRADLGADELAPEGSAHPYGLGGLGQDGLAPIVVAPDGTARLGDRLRIQLREARTRGGQPALAASLFAGATESSAPLPFELRWFGAPGSFLWHEMAVPLGHVGVDAGGGAQVTLALPSDPALAGACFTCQWLVLAPGANDAGLVTSAGLRVTLGR